jgi:hypothetical protein
MIWKSPQHDWELPFWHHLDHGLYWLRPADGTLASPERGVQLDEVERILSRPTEGRQSDGS